MSAVYLFRLDSIIRNKIRGSLRTQTSKKGFLNEKYLAIQILRNAIVSRKGEETFPREKLYADKAFTQNMTDELIGSFKLFDYNYPDCRVEFVLHDESIMVGLIPGSIWDVEAIYFDSPSFYQEKREQWNANTLGTKFNYFIDPTYFPDLCLEISCHEKMNEHFIQAAADFFEALSTELGIYISKPHQEREELCILFDFQTSAYSEETLEKILLNLNETAWADSIQSIRLR